MFLALIMFLIFFSIGMGPIVWTVNSEIYPIYLTGTANAVSTANNLLYTFMVSSFLLSLTETDVGKMATFGLMGFTALACTVFVYYFLPETANRNITENVQNIIGLEVRDELLQGWDDQTKNQF